MFANNCSSREACKSFWVDNFEDGMDKLWKKEIA